MNRGGPRSTVDRAVGSRMDGQIFKSAKGYAASNPSHWLGIERRRVHGGETAAPASTGAVAPWPERAGAARNRAPKAGAWRGEAGEGAGATGNPFWALPAARVDGRGLATAAALGERGIAAAGRCRAGVSSGGARGEAVGWDGGVGGSGLLYIGPGGGRTGGRRWKVRRRVSGRKSGVGPGAG